MKHIDRMMLLMLFVPLMLFAVDFHPKVKEQLQASGKLETMTAEYEAARQRGLDSPAGNVLKVQQILENTETFQINGLVILVDFNDHTADTVNHSQSDFDELLFSTGTYPTGSMNDFYMENSNNKLGIDGVITSWLRMPQNYSYYVNGQAGLGSYPRNSQKLVEDAIAAADPYVDFSQYDNDGDGYVDALFLVHSGPGRETTGSNSDIHSHAWSINPQMRDGVIIYRYSIEPETQYNHLTTMGVFAHEFGHVLGLPDLYDTDYSSSGIGNWSVMAGGSWAGPSGLAGAKPVHFDAWCKQRLGWINPVQLTSDSMAAAIRPIVGDSSAYRLWTNGAAGSEYFLVEYKKKEGFDTYLPGEGVLIWHVDENVPGNSNDWHRKVDLEQADGLFQLNNGSGSGDSGDPFPGYTGNTSFSGLTSPNSNSYQGQESLVGVANIADNGNGATADLLVSFPLPLVSIMDITVNDSLGDQQGDLDPGEHVWLSVKVANAGAETQNIDFSVQSAQSSVNLQNTQFTLGTLGQDTVVLKNIFEVTVSPAAVDPSFARFDLTMMNSYFNEDFSAVMAIGDQPGFSSDMETDDWLWVHYPVLSGFLDQWTPSQGRNHTPGGSKAYKLGQPGIGGYYSSGVYAGLETPWLEMSGDMELEFSTWYYIESSSTPGQAYDGALVEVTYDGINYQQVTPAEGYTHQIINNPDSPFAPGTPVFSGYSGGWLTYHATIPAMGDQVKIRFAFGSDAASEEEGWYIDDVRLDPTTTAFGLSVAEGWNLIGLPAEVGDAAYLSLFPNAVVNTLFSYNGSYTVEDSLQLGTGYWLKFPAAGAVNVSGLPVTSVNTFLNKDWNLISGPSGDLGISQINDPSNIIIPGTLFGMDTVYALTDSLKAGRGYWIRAGDSGYVTLSAGAALNPVLAKKQGELLNLSEFPAIVVSDAAGNQRKLYYNVSLEKPEQKLSYSLPPLPPAGAFDARFSGDYRIAETENAVINIQSSAYPVKITIHNPAPDNNFEYVITESSAGGEKQDHVLKEGEGVQILNPAVKTVRFSKKEIVPLEFTVHQNYPNPFNPETLIEYSIPAKEQVEISVYNTLGQQVRTLVSEIKEAGNYQVVWNGRNNSGTPAASGLYYYTVKAGDHLATKKMLLLR
ncbi:MAG: M6 family metalloprotease domain-containing protein [Calditrichia bacterium]